MFIHLGGDTVVRSTDVIAIIDNHMESSKITKEFLDQKDGEQLLIRISKEETKSYVIMRDKVYCSPISSLTLKRRANFVSSLESR
ncbi:extracellular matrix regulator RemB [Ammoniphilus sp. 3BR4]|uniref:extracellular matrix regulator RemB n=1 Tax=Ammoniphilus sp. 3BR4 TaxID=3158265 RepID=UPI0034673A0F